jgi:hypothetical protein
VEEQHRRVVWTERVSVRACSRWQVGQDKGDMIDASDQLLVSLGLAAIKKGIDTL